MSEYWFRPKSYGYGATPANWKGWLATAAFAALVVSVSLLLTSSSPTGAAGPAPWQVVTWAFAVALLCLAFVRLARAKTDGQWSWRWGK